MKKKHVLKLFLLTSLCFAHFIFANKHYKNENFASKKMQAPPRPMGKMSFKINGELFTADPNNVTCTYVGTQAVIFGKIGADIKMEFSYFHKAEIGKVPEIGGSVSGGFAFKKGLVEYSNNPNFKSSKMHITITKTKAIGRYVVVAGTFDGYLHDKSGNKILITDGKFESGHL
jgi:hypothetical protein